jgi:hypothetical protein
MISGIVPFEEIVQSVKDETGIANMRPYYDKIRRLIFRGEREIGYGGSVVLKKQVYKNPTHYNGKYFPFPEDFMELEGIGQCCVPVPRCNYTPTADGIRFKTTQTKDVVLLYWGLYCDEQGYPVCTRNHEEAIIAFIVWKMYRPKIFLGTGNMNAHKDYEQTFNNFLLEARGDDAFPTLEEWNEIALLSYSDRRGLLMYPTAGYNYCTEDIKENCIEINDGSSGGGGETNLREVYFWQVNNLEDDIEIITPLLSLSFFDDKESKLYSEFETGQSVSYTNMGRACFAITNTQNLPYQIFNELNIDITNHFEVYYDQTLAIYLFVSSNFYSYSNIFFKFKTV